MTHSCTSISRRQTSNPTPVFVRDVLSSVREQRKDSFVSSCSVFFPSVFSLLCLCYGWRRTSSLSKQNAYVCLDGAFDWNRDFWRRKRKRNRVSYSLFFQSLESLSFSTLASFLFECEILTAKRRMKMNSSCNVM